MNFTKLVLLLCFGLLILTFSPVTVNAAFGPALQKQDRFIWVVKRLSSGRLTNTEINDLANNYSIVVFGRMHDDHNITLQKEDAGSIKAVNPNVKVFAYLASAERFTDEDALYGHTEFAAHPAWYLLDSSSNKIPVSTANGYYLDLSNASLRTWMETLVKGWLTDGAFDGIAYDNVRKLSTGFSALPQSKIDSWNTGLDALFTETKAAIGSKNIIFNGVQMPFQGTVAEPRNPTIISLGVASQALDEFFCYRSYGQEVFLNKSQMLDDAKFFYDNASTHKIGFLAQVLYTFGGPTPTATEFAHTGRYCFGAFLLSYVPGYTKFKIGNTYVQAPNTPVITQNAYEINLPLGSPVGKYFLANGLYQRKFENGLVVVNLDPTNIPFTVPEPLILSNGGGAGVTLTQGQTMNITPQSSYFFVKTSSVTPTSTLIPTRTPTPSPTPATRIPGDYIDDGDLPGDQVNLFDYNFIMTALQTNYGNPYTIQDYNNVLTNFGL